MSKIEFAKHGEIGVLKVNRPEVHNALDWESMQNFSRMIKRIHSANQIRALIITGEGKSFVSGGDLKVLDHYPKRRHGARLSKIMSRALERLRALPMPTIAAINGPARGGGAEIAVACDMRVMADNADIGFVHSRLGITTAWGGARFLLQLVGYSQALMIMASGGVLYPGKALQLGLVDRVVSKGEALQKSMELAKELSQHPKESVEAAKRLLRLAIAYPSVANLAERQIFAGLWDSDFRREQVKKFLKALK
jgi:enoyl-CoA hydratase